MSDTPRTDAVESTFEAMLAHSEHLEREIATLKAARPEAQPHGAYIMRSERSATTNKLEVLSVYDIETGDTVLFNRHAPQQHRSEEK